MYPSLSAYTVELTEGRNCVMLLTLFPALPDNESELGRILLPKQVESQLTKTLF